MLSVVPPEFVVFGLTLIGISLFHRYALAAALVGLVTTILLRFAQTAAGLGAEASAIVTHFGGEAVGLSNLFLLLVGFAVVSNHFELSNIPEFIPARLPKGWLGGISLLAVVFCLSIFLDNIAGAVIGGVLARHLYRAGVAIGFQAAIVAAANAGGAGSAIGDTTTTMMWISGISPLQLAPAFIGAAAAFAVFAPIAAIQQQRISPTTNVLAVACRIDWTRALVVLIILSTLVAANVIGNVYFKDSETSLPTLGLGLWAAVIVTMPLRSPRWNIIPAAVRGAIFLITLVALASLMPVDRLLTPSTISVLGLGALSAVFDNIPLTALALKQGGYDWALLAYAVGFGGSMIWFGSSAGVALTNIYPEGRSVVSWLYRGWFIPLAYLVGFVAMLATR